MPGRRDARDHGFGIGTVAKQTGLTDHTIRVWERRYGAVVARRAPNGRRIYTPADVEKLGLLKRLTDSGESIGQIANDSADDLRERVRSLTAAAAAPQPERIAVAVLGDFLPARFSRQKTAVAPLDVVVSATGRERFEADLGRADADVVVFESACLDDDTLQQLRGYMEQAGADCGIFVYGFARAHDVARARDSGIVVLRSPADVDDIRAAVLRGFASRALSSTVVNDSIEAVPAEWDYAGPVAPRRFDSRQLAMLAQSATAIDCECPHHLAQLVGELTAFEIYSANCASRDEDDAALHRYLHRTTAEARALIEQALERVADAEGIDY